MYETVVMSDAPKYRFDNKGDFRKSLRALRLSGGERQKATEHVDQIIGALELCGIDEELNMQGKRLHWDM